MARVLVIEDDSDTGDMLSCLLEAGGYTPTHVETVAKAVRALEVDAYDLVLSDLMVAGVTVPPPWAYVERVVDLAKPAPVGLLTGWSQAESEAASRGVAFVLSKPCPRDRLFAQLGNALKLPPLTAQQVETIRTYFRCIETGAYEQLRSIVCDDLVYRLPGSNARYSHELHGIDAFIDFTGKTFAAFTEPKFEIRSIRPLPHGALVEYIGAWGEGSARRQLPGAVIFELAGAAIRRVEVRLDPDDLL